MVAPSTSGELSGTLCVVVGYVAVVALRSLGARIVDILLTFRPARTCSSSAFRTFFTILLLLEHADLYYHNLPRIPTDRL